MQLFNKLQNKSASPGKKGAGRDESITQGEADMNRRINDIEEKLSKNSKREVKSKLKLNLT